MQNYAGKELFGSGHVEQYAKEHHIPYLCSLPLDPQIAAASDNGIPFASTGPGALHTLAAKLFS